MAKILDKTVIGMNAPKQTNVTWIDTSDGTPVQRNNINGKWKPIGGGTGSSRGGSSNPTESDVNKVWQVTPVQKGTQTKETVIVPEQTCNMEEDGKFTICTLQNVDESFIPGFSGIAILDGMEYDIEWPVNNDSFQIGGFEIGSIISDNLELADYTHGLTHTIKVITRETESLYDYNWAPGVKIPVPTARDEGKILVVTKTEGNNTSVIVPEQEVPADENTPLTDVDLTKFVVGNTVKVTITYGENTEGDPNFVPYVPNVPSEQEVLNQPTSLTEVIKEDNGDVIVTFDNDGNLFDVWQIDNSLYTNAIGVSDPTSTIKLEYIESSYEYQLQENSGGGSGSSNILYCEGTYDHGTVTAYIDSSELNNPQITTIVVDIEEQTLCFYRMNGDGWLVSGFNSFEDKTYWIQAWNIEDQYPTIQAYFYDK